jgi:hypothetical protein
MTIPAPNLCLSDIFKEINVLKNLLLESQTVLDRSKLLDFKAKALDCVNNLQRGDVYQAKPLLEAKFTELFHGFCDVNDSFNNYVSDVIQSKEQTLNKTLSILKDRVELKMQVSQGKNYSYDPVLISYLKDDKKFSDRVKNLLHRHTDFRYPGLMIGLDYLTLTDYMVSNDQLYVVLPTETESSLDEIYNPIYVRSIRKYPYKLSTGNHLSLLPENQFGLIASTVYEDTLPNAQIVEYFTTVKSLLRPGGSLFFTFFDYNNVLSFELIEQITNYGENLMDPLVVLPPVRTYTDYKNIIESLGLSVQGFVQGSTHNLLVVRKDGELKTAKAKKVIGEILDV